MNARSSSGRAARLLMVLAALGALLIPAVSVVPVVAAPSLLKVGNSVTGVALTNDGGTLYAANSDDSTIRVFNTASGAQTASISVKGRLGGKITRKNGHYVITGGTDLRSDPIGIVLTPDGKSLYVSNGVEMSGVPGGMVVVIDTAARKVVAAVATTQQPTSWLAANPKAGFVYAVSHLGCSISVINTSLNTAAPAMSLPCSIDTPIVNRDGTRAYIGDTSNGKVIELDLTSSPPTLRRTIAVGGTANGIALSPDGSMLLVASAAGSGGLTLVNLASGAVVATIPTGTIQQVVVNSSGTIAYATHFDAKGTVLAVDLLRRKVSSTTAVGAGAYALVLSPQQDRLYVANQNDGTVSIIPVSNPSPGGAAPAPVASPTPSSSVTPSPTSGAIASASAAAIDPLLLIVLIVVAVLVALFVIVLVLLLRRKQPDKAG